MSAFFCGKRVAGDFYDAIQVGNGRILFGLLDVAGRRDDTRGILSATQQLFRVRGAELFAPADLNESNAMTELCLVLNRGVMEAADGVRSCPAFIGCYHEGFGTLCYTNAGHTPGLLRDATEVMELGSTGLPLGLFSHATCDAPTVGIAPGSILLLVSRGVIEGMSKRHDAEAADVALGRVKDYLQNSFPADARSNCACLLDAISDSEKDRPEADDMTALTLIRKAR